VVAAEAFNLAPQQEQVAQAVEVTEAPQMAQLAQQTPAVAVAALDIVHQIEMQALAVQA
jgi:hypothetical protein